MIVYISGKISGLDPEITEKKFKAAEEKIKECFHCQVVNPYSLCQSKFRDNPAATWLDKMVVCISALAKCQGLCRLPDWCESEGALIEVAMAKHYYLFLYTNKITQVRFYNGGCFSEKLPHFTVQYTGLQIGKGIEDWGAEKGKDYFCISFRNVHDCVNCCQLLN